MTTNLLLSHKYKALGWCLLVPGSVLGIFLSFSDYEAFPWNAKVFALFNEDILEKGQFFGWVDTNLTNTLVGALFIVGALLVSFTKEKREDEFIAKIRLNALLWAVLVNYILLLMAFLLVYGMGFLQVMVYNMFTIPIIFLARFHYLLYQSNKTLSDDQ